jgi:hypothetical protein
MGSDPPKRPLYARLLQLRYLHPGGLLCFLFFEGMLAIAVLLALAELTPWWVVIILPGAVALMVKVNDVVAGLGVQPAHSRSTRKATQRPLTVRGSAPVTPPLRASAPAPVREPTVRQGGSSGGSARVPNGPTIAVPGRPMAAPVTAELVRDNGVRGDYRPHRGGSANQRRFDRPA